MCHYRECGLRNIWLANGFEEHDTLYGEGVAIHDLEGLHRTIAHGLVGKGGKLTGAELRFLRHEMDLSQAKLADRFIRAIYRELNEGNAHIRDMIEQLVDSDVEDAEARITLTQDGEGWKRAA